MRLNGRVLCLKLSALALCFCGLCLLRIFRLSQGGGWEVPIRDVAAMDSAYRWALLFFLAGLALFLAGLKTFAQAGLADKILFLGWGALILAAFAVVWHKGGPVDAFRLGARLRYSSDTYYWLGLGLNAGLMLKLLWTL